MGQKQKQKFMNRMFLLLWLVTVLFSVLAVATYTWFTMSRTPQVSDMMLFVNSNSGLSLAWKPDGEWSQHLDFQDRYKEIAPLKPITYSYEKDQFFAATYGLDGRIIAISDALTDARNANQTGSNGYYLKLDFYASTEEPISVKLTPAAEMEGGEEGVGTFLIGRPVWQEETLSHQNGGYGSECAVRLGFRITKTDKRGIAIPGVPQQFYLYEPNCDSHFGFEKGPLPTPSIDGGDQLVPQDHLILQSSTDWVETDPVLMDAVQYRFGEFLTETKLFTLAPEELAHIEVYVWLEGQDADCINEIGQAAQLLCNIQFLAETAGGGGLQPIE